MHPLLFDNRFVHELPGDTHGGNSPRPVIGALWSAVMPTPVRQPQLLAYSPEMADLLGWAAQDVQHPDFTQVFAGNQLLEGMQPYAANYGGHQFGHWAGQLGDGRAISLGEVVNAQGQRWELQLKGAGMTPYSRRADGRAVLRSSLREFLCSEAMHHLGVPTTRALSLIATGEGVVRDMFYDGNPQVEPGAIVCRVAPSFIRFGNFELPSQRGELGLLEKLVDFTISRDFPELEGDTAHKRHAWFLEVCRRTALLLAHWMRVGFVHGVMNTDNMSILGLTLDYGPYGWLEDYDPNWTPNTTDAHGRRYAYGQQPYVAHWNLARLADALHPLLAENTLADGLQLYADVFDDTFNAMLAQKLGLRSLEEADSTLVNRLFRLLHQSEVDFTLFFRQLAQVDLSSPSLEPLLPAFYQPERLQQQRPQWQEWLQHYQQRCQHENWDAADRRRQMDMANPRFVLRNYLAQQAIDRATAGDTGMLLELLEVLRHPYAEQPHHVQYAQKRPEWARHKAGCSMLSCSS